MMVSTELFPVLTNSNPQIWIVNDRSAVGYRASWASHQLPSLIPRAKWSGRCLFGRGREIEKLAPWPRPRHPSIPLGRLSSLGRP